MKTTLKILGVEAKTSKNGQAYDLFTTSQGKMSCFEAPVASEVRANIGQECEVSVREKDNFKNIVGVYLIPNVGEEPKLLGKLDDTITPKTDKFSEARVSKDNMMKLSYRKDIFNNLCTIYGKVPSLEIARAYMKMAEVVLEQAEEGLK